MSKINDKDLKTIIKSIEKEAKALEGKIVLISGGSGFIGSYINAVLYLLNKKVLKNKCRVISIDNYITGSKENFLVNLKDKNFKLLNADIRQPIALNEKVDYIIHAAGLASPYYYKKYPLETIESAILGAKNLLELAKVSRPASFLFFSSSEIYGDPDPKFVPTPETYAGHVSSIGPRACYDESKRLTETLCITYHQLYDIPIKIVRPFNIYGPGMKHVDYRVIPTFIYSGLSGRDLPVHDKGIQTRTFCYVTDAIVAIFKVLISGKKGEVYNIGNDNPEIGMFELAQTIADMIGSGVKPRRKNYPENYPAGEPQRRCPDLTKIKNHLNYQPKVDLRTGLKQTINWFKQTYQL
ncbi:NAD-dependent epimerase/dehydratase family protein [Candidatus Daviesbacteria bacterium]|nr:NAD-dependent epimerase/dehydratase family protein [Candidatus Daviesbacteria bacterium]